MGMDVIKKLVESKVKQITDSVKATAAYKLYEDPKKYVTQSVGGLCVGAINYIVEKFLQSMINQNIRNAIVKSDGTSKGLITHILIYSIAEPYVRAGVKSLLTATIVPVMEMIGLPKLAVSCL